MRRSSLRPRLSSRSTAIAPLDDEAIERIEAEWRGEVRRRRRSDGRPRDLHVRYWNADRARTAQAPARPKRSAPSSRAAFCPSSRLSSTSEWWRGRNDIREEILAAVVVEDMPRSLCRAAGEALGAVKGASLADAVVMASAALRGGGVVYTVRRRRSAATSAPFPNGTHSGLNWKRAAGVTKKSLVGLR